MSLTLLGEKAEERQRSASVDEVQYRRVYLVQSDSDSVGPLQIAFCPGVPLLGFPYATSTETDATCLVVDRKVQQVTGSRRLWAVELTYSNKHEDPEENQNEQEQLELEPPEVEFSFETYRVPLEGKVKLINSSGIEEVNKFGGATTSAGEPFDPPPEIDASRPVLTVSRNELVFNSVLAITYENAVNSDAFLGANPGQVRVQGISARRQYKKGLRYWRVQYQFVYRKETWDLELLDIGTWYLEANAQGTIEKKRFVTDDDPPQPRLGLLNGFGVANDAEAPPVFRRFEVYPRLPFANLNIRIQ